MRELLGLSQEQLAKIASVSRGSVSRFERGGALSTPWIVAIKVRLAFAAQFRQLDPDLLSDDVRRFLENTVALSLPDDPALPPRNDSIALLPAPDVTGIVRAHRRVPESARAKFVAIMDSVVAALADRKS